MFVQECECVRGCFTDCLTVDFLELLLGNYISLFDFEEFVLHAVSEVIQAFLCSDVRHDQVAEVVVRELPEPRRDCLNEIIKCLHLLRIANEVLVSHVLIVDQTRYEITNNTCHREPHDVVDSIHRGDPLED